MKPACKILYILLLIFAFYNRRIQAQTVKSEQALYSDFLYDFFSKEGFKPEKQLLQNTLSRDFPYNVLVSINKGENRKKLVVAVPQQDIQPALPAFTDFMQKISTRDSDCQTEFVFTANDYKPAAKKTDKSKEVLHKNAGTLTYVDSVEAKENTVAIIVRFAEKKQNIPLYGEKFIEIIPGGTGEYGRGTVIPHFFFKILVNAFKKSNIDYRIKGNFLFLYRIGLIKSDALVSSWLSANIPALMFIMNEDNITHILNVIENSIGEYQDTKIFTADSHYSVFRFFNRMFWVSEKMYIVFLTLSAAVTLFLFFILSFIRGSHRHIHREEFFKTWYLIPLIICITALLLFFAQFMTTRAIGKHTAAPLFFLTTKTVFAVTFFVFVFFPLASCTLKLPVTGFIYGYLLLPASFLNIFLFATVDIALIPLFTVEYIIVLVSRTIRKVVPLMCCLIFMLLPYIPLIQAIALFDSPLCTHFVGNAGFTYNALFAAILLPFLIMLVRILIRFKLWKTRGKEAKSKIRKQAFFASLFFGCFFLLTFGISFFIRPEQKKDCAQLTADNIQSVSLFPERTMHFGRSVLTLKLSSKLPVARYHIEVSSETVLPVFESNYPYDIFLKPSTAVFPLDDYPPDPFVLTFSAEGVHDTVCTVTAYIQTDAGIQTEKHTYTIAGVQK